MSIEEQETNPGTKCAIKKRLVECICPLCPEAEKFHEVSMEYTGRIETPRVYCKHHKLTAGHVAGV
jgi:hypothetical protein